MSDSPAGRLMLVDSASLYFRAYHGVPDSVTSPQGEPVNAVRGLLDMFAYLIDLRRPTRFVACWDLDWRPAFRTEAIPSYKAHRLAYPGGHEEIVPDGLVPQVPVIIEVLEALGICRLGAEGHEADDVIGTLVAREQARKAPDEIDVVTGDRDLLQLVDDDTPVRVLYTGKGVRKLETIDQKALEAKYGVPTGPGYAVMATLRGDPSDGLPGVAGIGEKSAAGLVGRFGSLEAIRAAAEADDDSIAPGLRKKLLAAADYLDVAPVVVTVAPGAPVPEADDTLPHTPADHDAVVALAERWGLSSSLSRIITAMSSRD